LARARLRLVLDSGALSYLAENDGSLRAALLQTLNRDIDVVVPTAVIAEATAGNRGRDANLNSALHKTVLIDLDEQIARSAARLRHTYRRAGAGTVDAIVVATADIVPGTRVLTGDPVDLGLLASVQGRTRIVALSEME
jgi:predicted nucleic acid-binding protein